MSSIQFEELTIFNTHEKNDMYDPNNSEWLYFHVYERLYVQSKATVVH